MDALSHRLEHAEELMDQPSIEPGQLRRALTDLQWVNRYLGGTGTILREVRKLMNGSTQMSWTALDLGTGSADIPIGLVKWGQAKQIDFKVTAVDLHPTTIVFAQQWTNAYPNIKVEQGDALNLPYPDGQFDIVTNSLFLHHLTNEEAVRLLQEMARMCRLGFIVSDLKRSRMTWLGTFLLGKLTGKGPVFQHDGPVSVQRSFTRQDIEVLSLRSGLPELNVDDSHPFRLILTWKKPAGWSPTP